MPDPYKKLVTVLESRFAGIAARSVSGVPAELGTITGSGIKLDSFKYDIPDYMIDDRMVGEESPRPGDRVLAIPVNGGKDIVVLCKVVKAGG